MLHDDDGIAGSVPARKCVRLVNVQISQDTFVRAAAGERGAAARHQAAWTAAGPPGGHRDMLGPDGEAPEGHRTTCVVTSEGQFRTSRANQRARHSSRGPVTHCLPSALFKTNAKRTPALLDCRATSSVAVVTYCRTRGSCRGEDGSGSKAIFLGDLERLFRPIRGRAGLLFLPASSRARSPPTFRSRSRRGSN